MAMTKMKKAFIYITLILIVGLGLFGYIYYHVPYSDSSVEVGVLNKIEHKGHLFKTYEGEVVLYEEYSPRLKEGELGRFRFSVEDEDVAKRLMDMKGYEVRLHYKEYLGILPWRGESKFVVDSIVSIVPYNPDSVPNINGEPPVDELIDM